MNRAISRGSEWRNKVKKLFERPDIDFVIDSHSFPSQYPAFANCDIVLYAESFSAAERWRLGMTDAVESDGKTVCGFVATPLTTDVVQDAHEHGLEAALVEFREGMENIRAVADRIAEYVCTADFDRVGCRRDEDDSLF
jgi:hypothetical protein